MKILPIVTVVFSLILGLCEASAIDIVATSAPIVTGSGAGMTARYENVATQDGISLDVFAEILTYSPAGLACVFRSVDDDMMFQFRNGVTGMQRNASIRWTFYENGTTTPVTVTGLTLTVDDLDNLPTRQESLVTSNASGFDLNDPTNVTATLVGSTITAAGGIEQNSGDPEGAVKLYFTSVSSFVIDYQTIHGSALVSAYHHDGDSDFTFGNPVHTPVPQPFDCSYPRIYYTYNFNNDGYFPVLTTFSNRLPSGMTWDTDYTPAVTGGLQVQIEYEEQNRDAIIPLLLLPPGDSTLTLCTFDVEQSGAIGNEAKLGMFMLDPPHPEDPPHPSNWHQYQTTAADITLEPLDEVRLFICQFKKSMLCGYSLFAFGAGNNVNTGGATSVHGTVGLAAGVTESFKNGNVVTGPIYMDAPDPIPLSGTVDANSVPTIVISQSLSAPAADAVTLSNMANALASTGSSVTTIGNGTVIDVTSAPGDFHVYNVSQFSLSGSNTATLQGGPEDWLIVNTDELRLTGSSRIVVDGFSPGHVLINLTSANTQQIALTGGASTLPVTILAPNRSFNASGSTTINGAVYIGGNATLVGNARINGSYGFGCDTPCCGS
ncbi:MAG: hypothetical protein ACI9R3_002856 [Verrucomicrobiales bacterium]|jgi:hypothetical protein